MKLKIIKSPRQCKVYDENESLVAVVHNKLLNMDKNIENIKDNEKFSTSIVNSENCYVFDSDGNEVAYGIIRDEKSNNFKQAFFGASEKVTIEFGEDSYVAQRTKGDNLVIKKQGVDEDFVSDIANVYDISKRTSIISSDTDMSITTLIVIFIFTRYLYDSKFTMMV